MVMNEGIPKRVGNFLISWMNVSWLVGHPTGYLTICGHNLVSHNLQNSAFKRMCLEVQNAAVCFAKSFVVCYIHELIPEVISS
jgi:hypothetical protein